RPGELRLPLPAVEIAIPHSLPLPGSFTTQLKVLRQSASAHELSLELEAQGGSVYDLPLRENGVRSPIHAEGASVGNGSDAKGMRTLHVVFPAGERYQRQTVRLTW
ncbi:MAG TPA: hypothetical protein VHB45_02540, partial [Alloacidobacterium sp.]|nr:hypothetical protein [Alloacidobacterium sp.]